MAGGVPGSLVGDSLSTPEVHPWLFAIAVFVVALALIASERVDRTKIALLGATLVVLAGTLDQEQAIEAVDFNTIGLLVGMMIMVRVTETTGRLHVAGDPRRAVVRRAAAGGGARRWRSRPRCCRRSWTT